MDQAKTLSWLRYRRKEQGYLLFVGLFVVGLGLSIFTILLFTSGRLVETELEKFWRSSYDILVTASDNMQILDDENNRLIEPNFLSGIEGGITIDQYEQIKSLPNVEVAAPIAEIGYFPIDLRVYSDNEVPVDPYAPWHVFKDVRTIVVSDGIRFYTVSDETYTVCDRTNDFGFDPQSGAVLISPSGEKYLIQEFLPNPLAPSTQKVRIMGRNMCVDRDGKPAGHSFNESFNLYLLVVGIEPSQEDALIGLKDSVNSGRYLDIDDRPVLGETKNDEWEVPILFSESSFRNIEVYTSTYSLEVPPDEILPERLETIGMQYLLELRGSLIQEDRQSLTNLYTDYLHNFGLEGGGAIGFLGGMFWEYIAPSPVTYAIAPSFPNYYLHVEAQPVGASNVSPIESLPLSPTEISFRKSQLQKIMITNENSPEVQYFTFVPIGSYDITDMRQEAINQVPLESYSPPQAVLRFDQYGDPVEPRILHPTNNPYGYLSEPPHLLTTLQGARFLSQRDDFISAIRIRVSGIDKIGETSQELIESVAQQIEISTGLHTDITLGSSPAPVLVSVPGFGDIPPLGALEERWIRQKVGIGIYRGKNVADSLFSSGIILSSVLFSFSVSLIAALTRKKEIGLLQALGWRKFNVVFAFLWNGIALALSSGLIATAAVIGFIKALGLEVTFRELALPIPLTVLVFLGGISYPAWRLLDLVPISLLDQMNRVKTMRRIKLTSKFTYSMLDILRSPTNTRISLFATAFSISFFVFYLAISSDLSGSLEGTLLGQHIEFQLRPYHFGMTMIMLFLSSLQMLDIWLFKVSIRKREIATVLSLGWKKKDIVEIVLFASLTQGLSAGFAGSIFGIAGYFVLMHQLPARPLQWILLGPLFSCLISSIIAIYPAYLSVNISLVQDIQ